MLADLLARLSPASKASADEALLPYASYHYEVDQFAAMEPELVEEEFNQEKYLEGLSFVQQRDAADALAQALASESAELSAAAQAVASPRCFDAFIEAELAQATFPESPAALCTPPAHCASAADGLCQALAAAAEEPAAEGKSEQAPKVAAVESQKMEGSSPAPLSLDELRARLQEAFRRPDAASVVGEALREVRGVPVEMLPAEAPEFMEEEAAVELSCDSQHFLAAQCGQATEALRQSVALEATDLEAAALLSMEAKFTLASEPCATIVEAPVEDMPAEDFCCEQAPDFATEDFCEMVALER